jgi:Holliday junction resolvase
MSHPSKRKGNSFERELVSLAKQWGFHSKRAYASNGQSLGFHEEVDLIIEEYKVQAKRRKKIANFLKCENTDIVAFREDRGDTYFLMPADVFLTLLKKQKG